MWDGVTGNASGFELEDEGSTPSPTASLVLGRESAFDVYSSGIPRAECQTRANLANPFVVNDSVHDSIRPKNDLANLIVSILGNDATQLWKFLQAVCLGNKFATKRHCALGLSRAMNTTIS